MKSFALVALVVLAAFSNAAGTASKSPVETVVKLLEDLKGKVEQDSKVEQQAYDKFACWCDKTMERKATAIDEAQQQLRALGQNILKLKGQVATLESEISETKQAIAANLESQAAATSIRQKENADFQARTSEIKSTLGSLEQAVSAIIRGTSASLLQRATTARSAVQNLLQTVPATIALKPEHVAFLSAFSAAKSTADYAPQSSSVQAILKDMYATFSGDLESATGAEANANRHFEVFIHEKTVEHTVLSETLARKEAEKSQAELLLAETVQDYDATEAQREADIAFFDQTKAACIQKHEDWENRVALREEEVTGINKALEILTSDEARALFASARKAGINFLQIDSVDAAGMTVVRAYASLKAQATATHSLRLAALAVQVRQAKVGHFEKVIKAIDDMVATLKAEDAADIAKRDQCKEEYQKTASTIAHVSWLIEKNEAKIHKLESIIELKTAEKEQTIAEIQDVTEQIALLENQRQQEHDAFVKAKADDEQAVAVLTEAMGAFTAYYKSHNINLLASKAKEPVFEVSADQAPETTFSGSDAHKNQSKGIVAFMENIIENLNAEIRAEVKAENAAQAEYEKQRAAAEQLKQDLINKKTGLEEAIAKREEEKSDEHASLRGNQADLADEKEYRAKITPDCDWIIGAFSERATRRTAEMKGLIGAKEYLAGASQASLLQGRARKSFDDSVLPSLRFLAVRQ